MPGAVDAINKVLVHEGGFVNDPDDKGGATNYGITQKVYEEFVGRKVSVDEIKNMPKGNAIAIYKKNYWDKIGGDKIKSYAVAYALFDQAVNRGVPKVVKQAQGILGISQDGIAGSGFVSAINKVPEKSFLDQFIKASENSYRSIASLNPTQEKFLKGWLNRLTSVKTYVSQNLGKSVGIGAGVIVVAAVAIWLLTRKSQSSPIQKSIKIS